MAAAARTAVLAQATYRELATGKRLHCRYGVDMSRSYGLLVALRSWYCGQDVGVPWAPRDRARCRRWTATRSPPTTTRRTSRKRWQCRCRSTQSELQRLAGRRISSRPLWRCLGRPLADHLAGWPRRPQCKCGCRKASLRECLAAQRL